MATPYDLLLKMSGIEYGAYDFNNNQIVKDPDKLDQYILLTPEMIYEKKIGTCWDCSLLEYIELKTMGYNPHMAWIDNNLVYGSNGYNTHTFIWYKDKGKYCWFEYSWLLK